MLNVVSEQPQGELCILDVAVRQQQQVPDAARRRQQAESSQGPPQLSAAPYWREALIGEREAELSGICKTQIMSRSEISQMCDTDDI